MLSYENGIATDNLPNEYYVVQIDGQWQINQCN